VVVEAAEDGDLRARSADGRRFWRSARKSLPDALAGSQYGPLEDRPEGLPVAPGPI